MTPHAQADHGHPGVTKQFFRGELGHTPGDRVLRARVTAR